MNFKIAIFGSFYIFVSKFESLKDKIRSKTGLNLINMRIMNQDRFVNSFAESCTEGKNELNLLIERDLIKVVVTLPNGSEPNFQIFKDIKVSGLKVLIEEKTKIPFNTMRLMYKYEVLKCDRLVLDCLSGDGEPHFVVRERLRGEVVVYVTCHKGHNSETVCLSVVKTDTVRVLKEKINDKCGFGIPPDNQKLCYLRTMRDVDVVGKYDLEDGSRLSAFYRRDLSRVWIEIEGRRENLSLDVRGSDLVSEVKERCGSSVDNEPLRLSFEGDVMKDGATLSQCGVTEDDVLQCEGCGLYGHYLPSGSPPSIGIIIEDYMNGKKKDYRYSLRVSPSDKVGYVKHMFAIKRNFRDKIMLYISNRGHRLDDENTLDDYQIEDGDSLMATIEFVGGGCHSVSVMVRRPSGGTFTTYIYGTMSTLVRCVREKIEEEGYSREEFYLTNEDGSELRDDEALTDSMKVVLVAKQRVRVNVVRREVFTDLEVDINESVSHIKKKISEELGLREQILQLYFKEKMLADNSNIASSPLGDGPGPKEVSCEILVVTELTQGNLF